VVQRLRTGENPASWALEQIGGGVAPDAVKVDIIVRHWAQSPERDSLERALAEIEVPCPPPSLRAPTQPHPRLL